MNGTWFGWAFVAVMADILLPGRLELSSACVALAWLYESRGADRLMGAWILGMMRDALSIGPFGVYALSFLTAGIVLESMRGRWFTGNIPSRIGILFGTILSIGLLAGALARLTGASAGVGSIVAASFGSAAWTTGLVAVAVGGGTWLKSALRWSRA